MIKISVSLIKHDILLSIFINFLNKIDSMINNDVLHVYHSFLFFKGFGKQSDSNNVHNFINNKNNPC